MTKTETLKKYLLMKADAGDWHAVSDAANDLRVMEAEAQALARQKPFLVEKGVQMGEETVNGVRYTTVRRG